MFINPIKSLKVDTTTTKNHKKWTKTKPSSLTIWPSLLSGEYVCVFLVYTALGERGDILSWGPLDSLCHRGRCPQGEQCRLSVTLKWDCHSPSANPLSPHATCSRRNATKAWRYLLIIELYRRSFLSTSLTSISHSLSLGITIFQPQSVSN